MFERPGNEIDIKTGNTILHDAVIYRKTYLVEDLCKLKGLDINVSNKENLTAFALAAYDGQSDVVATLLNTPNIIINIGTGKYSYTALQFAISRGITQSLKKSLYPVNAILISKMMRVQPLFISPPKMGK